jgi:hypothetical protein
MTTTPAPQDFQVIGAGNNFRRPRQAARIRDGWVHEKFSGTRDEFVQQTRRTHMYLTWIGLVGDVLLLVGEWFVAAGHQARFTLSFYVMGVSFLISGVVSFWSRRILDSPRQETPSGRSLPRLPLTRMLVPRPAAVQDLPHAYGICWPTWIPFRHTADGRD